VKCDCYHKVQRSYDMYSGEKSIHSGSASLKTSDWLSEGFEAHRPRLRQSYVPERAGVGAWAPSAPMTTRVFGSYYHGPGVHMAKAVVSLYAPTGGAANGAYSSSRGCRSAAPHPCESTATTWPAAPVIAARLAGEGEPCPNTIAPHRCSARARPTVHGLRQQASGPVWAAVV
jgi:hypothetical protein